MGTTDSSDADLLARIRSGDDSALDTLLTRYETPLFQFLVGILRDQHHAEDALQEPFVRALDRLDGVAPCHLRGWFLTVAYPQAMLARRRQKSHPLSPLARDGAADPGPGPLERVAQADDAQRVRELLQRLPAPQQEVIRQRVYEGKRF